jgi:transcriptional regulator with XRE-family HTH domain
MTLGSIIDRLNARRQLLGMSCAALAQQSGLSLRTIQRVLSGHEADPGFSTVLTIARVLSVTIQLAEQDVNESRLQQAQRGAEKVLALVQGTCALEAQAVDSAALKALRDRTVRDLLSGSNRKLWAE